MEDFLERGSVRPSRAEGNSERPLDRARSRKGDELGRRTKERRSLANQEERDAAL